FDTNMLRRSGSQSVQTGNNAMMTQTADGHTVVDTSQAISNLPVSMRLSSLASSGFSEQARQAEQQAQSSLDGYNHSVTSGFQQLNQLTQQSGNSDTVTQGSDNSVATNVSRGVSKMQSAVESYAKSHNVSEQQAYNQLMDITNQGGAGARGYVKFDSGDQLAGKVGKWATGLSAGGEGSVDWRHTSGSSHGTQDSHAEGRDNRHDQSSQEARDFRQGMDMVTSTRLSESGSHTDNQSNSLAQQFAATLNDAKSQYHQYTESSTRSQEFSRMATLSQTQSASLDANYNQEFVDWTTAKYGSDAQNILTNVRSAQGAATEFMHERLEPEIMRNYGARTDQVNGQPLQPAQSLDVPGGARSDDAERGSVPDAVRTASHDSQRSPAERRGSRVKEESVQARERNLTAPAGGPSQAMSEDFRSGSQRVGEKASGAGIESNVANKVAAQRSGLMETIRENDGKIAENKTTVQTSSDILSNEHQGAVRSQQIGRTEEDLRQTRPWIDGSETDNFKEKLQRLRDHQKKAS
ncbi:conjugal transfer protein TraG, partial [Pantoea sp. VS1]